MCVPACAHISTFDTLQLAPLLISAKRSMWTDGSVGQWTIPGWSGTETSIQFLLIASFRINEWTFHSHLRKSPALPEDSSISRVGMVQYASWSFALFPFTLTLSLR